jgi:hypothetical protein
LLKVWPRSRETAIRILVVSLLNTDHIAYTWSWYLLPGIALTATHCLSSTWPQLLRRRVGRLLKIVSAVALHPMSSHVIGEERSMAPSGCSFVASQNALNNVTWYARPLVSNATLGSVGALGVQ